MINLTILYTIRNRQTQDRGKIIIGHGIPLKERHLGMKTSQKYPPYKIKANVIPVI